MNRQLPIWLWTIIVYAVVFIFGIADLATGYESNISVFYFIPISLNAWFVGLISTFILGVVSALVWFGADFLAGHVYSSHFYPVWNTIIRLTSFLVIGWVVFRVRELLDRERRTADALRKALSEVKILEAFLPVCSLCKRIRNQQGEWQQMEDYIGQHSNTQFSHSYCPECARKAMREAGLIDEES